MKTLIAVGIVLGVAILIPVIHHYQLRAATEAYIAQLKAQGEPMELAQVIPLPVPPAQNGVPFIRHALTNLLWSGIVWTNPPQGMRMMASGRAIVGWRQPMIFGDFDYYRGFTATNTWEDLSRELAAAKGDLGSFQNLTNHPILDFNWDYQNLKIPQTGWVKSSAQWLCASAIYDLHEGHPQNACADVRAMLALVKGESNERPIISQLIRIAIAAIGANATWEILEDPNVSGGDLAQLQQDWQSLEFINPLEQAFKFDRAMGLRDFKQTRSSSEKFDKLWGYFYAPDAPKPDISQFGVPIPRSLFLRILDRIRWRWFWSYEDELYELRSSRVVIDATRIAETNKSFQAVQSFADSNLASVRIPAYARHKPQIHIRVGGIKGYGTAALRKAVSIEVTRNVVITAIALKRYELRHHQLPDTLGELVPEFLRSVPTDYMDGQPLRYRRNTDGTFLLYSVGENGKDDGGNPALEQGVESSSYYWLNPHALDWVWPQPATPEEVRNYYAHPPK
ncbi:MAG TPA: hypothetical protein VG077_00510 [Verrucomicrobiae bacterium]|nr:hypothetical protein [Verrucomicrobiae bacterium]